MSTTEQAPRADQTSTRPAPPASTLLSHFTALGTGSSGPGRGSTLGRHALVAVVLVVAVIGLSFLVPSYQNDQIARVLTYVVVIAGVSILIGLNGQISLGHSALMAVGGYTTAVTQNYLADRFVIPPPPGASGFSAVSTVQGWTIFVSILVGTVAATLAGLLVGLAAARLRGPYLAAATLALVGVVPAITTSIDVFNGDQGLRVKNPPLPGELATTFTVGNQWQVLVALTFTAVVMILLANLVKSKLGRDFRAVRDDEIAAQLSGIPVARTQITAFTVSAAAAGVAGGLWVFIYLNAQPGSFGLLLSLNLVVAIVLGGMGSLTGAVWGGILLIFVPYGLEQLSHAVHVSDAMNLRLKNNLPVLVFGLFLILVTIFAPGGIQNQVRRIGGWLRTSVRRSAR